MTRTLVSLMIIHHKEKGHPDLDPNQNNSLNQDLTVQKEDDLQVRKNSMETALSIPNKRN